MSPENNSPETESGQPIASSVLPVQPAPAQPQPKPAPAQVVDTTPNIVLGKDGTPLPEGPAVIGTKMVEIPNEEGQRNGFHVDPSMVSVIISQYPDFEFKVMKPLGT
jgi:hypothetical protein